MTVSTNLLIPVRELFLSLILLLAGPPAEHFTNYRSTDKLTRYPGIIF